MAKNIKTPVVQGPCQCGCGQTPRGRRSSFLPGHDTKARSAFRAAHPRAAFRFITKDPEVRAARAAKLAAYRASRKAAVVA